MILYFLLSKSSVPQYGMYIPNNGTAIPNNGTYIQYFGTELFPNKKDSIYPNFYQKLRYSRNQ